MSHISANDLKTKGVSAIEAVLSAHAEAIVSVRGKDRFVVMDMAHYRHLRECELEAALAQKPSERVTGGADIALIVTQGAAEKGFDLIKSANAAPGQMTFRMDQARAPALLTWLIELESQGVAVNSVTLRGGTNGSITVDAQLQKAAR